MHPDCHGAAGNIKLCGPPDITTLAAPSSGRSLFCTVSSSQRVSMEVDCTTHCQAYVKVATRAES